MRREIEIYRSKLTWEVQWGVVDKVLYSDTIYAISNV